MAERRWRDAELRRRGSKASSIGDSDECSQVGQVTTIHFMNSSQYRMQ
jgi:hypothetical protein